MNKSALLAVIVWTPVVGLVPAQSIDLPGPHSLGITASHQECAEREDRRIELNTRELWHREESSVRVHYLEIVTPSVNETCEALARAHGVTFSEPVAELGNARTAELRGGGRIGVRAPMRATERPVVRPYVLVDDIDAAVKAAEAAGAQFAMRPTEIPGQGTFAIYVLGGIDHGLWQVKGDQP